MLINANQALILIKVNPRINIGNSTTLNILLFADDLQIILKTENDLERTVLK